MTNAAIVHLLARFIPIRPWVALALLVVGVAMTIPAFYLHNLWLALAGALPLGGALGILLIPLPYPR
jgi:general stress protein CsbA